MLPRHALALVLSLVLAGPAVAEFDPAKMSDADRAAFDDAVRDYLMRNPEVLVEAIGVLEQRRAEDAAANDRVLVAANAPAIFEDGHSWTGGNPNGDVTMVEFIDYRCGVCRGVFAQIEDLVRSDGNIRVIYKEFPILGEDSILASRFAIAVQQIAGPEAYKQVHDQLMTMRGTVTLDSLGKLADDLKLDRAAIIDRLNTAPVTDVIRANAQLAEKLGINGTPSFVIGGELLHGVPQAGLEKVVAEARQAKG